MADEKQVLQRSDAEPQLDYEYSIERPQAAGKTLKRLWQTTAYAHGRLVLVLCSVLIYTALMIAAPWYSAGIVNLLWDTIKASQSVGAAFQVTWRQGGEEIAFLALLYFGAWLFYTFQSYMMLTFAEGLNLRLRTALSEKLNRLPLCYFDGQRTGAVLSRFTNDLDKVSEALQNGILRLFTSTGLLIGSVVMMFQFHAGLALVFIAFALLAVVVTRLFSRVTLERASTRQQKLSLVTGLIEEAYSGQGLIKAFTQETRSAAKVHAATEELAWATEKADFAINAIDPAIRLINRLGQVVIALFASYLLIGGSLTVGAFQAFFQYVNQASEPLTEASYVINSMQSALASAERVYALLDEPEMSADPAVPVALTQAKGKVVFDHVRFGYADAAGPDLMADIDFAVAPGQKIAIVGATGAGKTTLINLLMRFYDVKSGHIYLDDVDTASLTRHDLRENFGMVLQDTWLFEGTIAENIAYGKPAATRAEIIAAAKAARVDFFVRTMPKGYDTIVENDNENISTGQRQLLTIARVVLRNPPVLILDEATSSVDTRTEMEINHAMRDLMAGRTAFIIAHRLSTIVDADKILVMDHGAIIEQGTHRELLQKGGAYAALYNSQFAPV